MINEKEKRKINNPDHINSIKKKIEDHKRYNKYSSKWIRNCRIIYQSEKKNNLNSSILYRIEFTIEKETKSIYRRYTSFEILRNILREFFPCHFIFPVHYKKIVK